jgi:hypothetical protein
MRRVLTSQSTGAAIFVFSDDHCPPHVHARHRGDGWIARVRFSYLGSTVKLMSIAPLRNVPVQWTVNRLLAGIEDALTACRRGWWATRQTTCLTNQWAIVRPGGQIEIAPAPSVGAKQISDAEYDPDEERLRVIFHDGTTADVSTQP